ncbi:hypothetical protein MLD38_019945 [Melastoma candidum]|uniref:Uncharacterized protein n=1 Tax=Melastoma candidum TaxID=119954 RepID=A0ACB9QEC7_9MYRT|nr:hypothetical protein MLD38_019945 [Melastoma candidum]
MGKGTVFCLVVALALLLLLPHNALAQTAAPPAPTPAPAPAPAPVYVNLTDLLSVAGPFHTFLGYLQSTNVIATFQNQANNSRDGITIFAPSDDAFSSLTSPSLSNLTQDQLRSVCLFHALPKYYSLADFKSLSQSSPVATYAGGQYTLNFTYTFGLVRISSGWTNTKITSSVHATDPVAIYELDRVLLPEAIYGTNIPPAAAPAPSPNTTPAADAPATKSNSTISSTTGSKPSAAATLTVASSRGISIALIAAVLCTFVALV